MLDLKKLEAELDYTLANETCESLTQWLFSKRLRNLYNHLGKGTMEERPTLQSETFFAKKSIHWVVSSVEISALEGYPVAA